MISRAVPMTCHDRAQDGRRAAAVADGFDCPRDIVRDGERLILTEKAGHIVIVGNGEIRCFAVETSLSLRRPFGLALAPDFAQSGRAFLCCSYKAAPGLPTASCRHVSTEIHGTRSAAITVGRRDRMQNNMFVGLDGHKVQDLFGNSPGQSGASRSTVPGRRLNASSRALAGPSGKARMQRLPGPTGTMRDGGRPSSASSAARITPP